MEALRVCKQCNLEAHSEEDLDLFAVGSGCLFNRRQICKKCDGVYKRKWDKDNYHTIKHKKREYSIKHSYGISKEEYDTYMNTSVYCEICGTSDELCYDHNHNTMKFRGVLCRACNRALGSFKDNKDNLIMAIKYLEERGSYCDK